MIKIKNIYQVIKKQIIKQDYISLVRIFGINITRNILYYMI